MQQPLPSKTKHKHIKQTTLKKQTNFLHPSCHTFLKMTPPKAKALLISSSFIHQFFIFVTEEASDEN
jgi:hypothetical protein